MVGTRISSCINGLILGRTLGGTGLGVISLVTPVTLVYFSIGSLVGVGASIVSGIALGRGDRERCARVYTLSYIVMGAVAVVLTVAGMLNLDRIVRFLGADAEYFEYTRDFVRYYIMGGAGILLLYIPINYLRIAGKPNHAMIMLLLMSFLEIVGLWVFVILLDMGPGGTAIAWVIGSALTCFVSIGFLRGKDSPFALQKPGPALRDISSLVSSGSPSAANNVCRAIQSLSMNLLFVRMGMGMYLPCYTLVTTGADFILAVILGISQAALPLVGISFGERDFRSIRIILKKAMGWGNLIIGVMAILIVLIRNRIGLFFGVEDEEVLRNTGIGMLFFAFSINFAFINNVMMNYFNAIRRVLIANIIVISRLVLFMIIPAYALFPRVNIYAVWISLILTEIFTLGLTFLFVTLIHRRNPRLSRYLLLDDALVENSRVIDFSVQNTIEDVTFASGKISDFCEENEIPIKKITQIGLAIEEMLLMINEFSHREGKTAYTDVRMMITPENIVMRIRNAGRYFNPVKYYYENKDTEAGFDRTLGIGIILKMARDVKYRETFGVNNLIITI
jgi:Na+-driven multidrug efflux pump/anti-sigma regulatory factor (Ser/Thr protein kinase)